MRKSATLILLLACAANAQRPPAQTQSTEPETTLKVDVKLVNVYVTVTDAHGAPVGALKAFSGIMAQLSLDQKYDPLKISPPGADASGELAPPQPTDQPR